MFFHIPVHAMIKRATATFRRQKTPKMCRAYSTG